MPNQRAIAAALGLNQSTVSRALRGDPDIAEATRERVMQEVQRMDYHPNAYVTSLMSHIRSGRPLRDKGCIALMVNGQDLNWWHRTPVYADYHRGVLQRAKSLGFYAECFFIQSESRRPNLARLDHILHSRGIRGLILAPPFMEDESLLESFHWERYATVTIGFSWPVTSDRVANDHYYNATLAYAALRKRGYERIALCLPNPKNPFRPPRWLGGYIQCEQTYHGGLRIPIFYGNPDDTPLSTFERWFHQHRPDALLTAIAHEMEWLRAMKLQVPRDVAVACLVRSPGSPLSGIEESNSLLGSVSLELVAGKIMHNQFGLPDKDLLTLIKGNWVDADSCRSAPLNATRGDVNP